MWLIIERFEVGGNSCFVSCSAGANRSTGVGPWTWRPPCLTPAAPWRALGAVRLVMGLGLGLALAIGAVGSRRFVTQHQVGSPEIILTTCGGVQWREARIWGRHLLLSVRTMVANPGLGAPGTIWIHLLGSLNARPNFFFVCGNGRVFFYGIKWAKKNPKSWIGQRWAAAQAPKSWI